MKHKLSLTIGAIVLAAAAGAQAQTAVTDPVGYITLTARGGSQASKSLNLVSPTLVNKVEFSGAISAITATTISFTGTPLGALTPNAYYVEITSGAKAGYWTTITAATASAITTADDMTPVASAGTTVKIRKHVTINDIFGETNSAGLKTAGEIGQADVVTLINSETRAVTRLFYYTDPGDATVHGWINEGGDVVGDLVVEPQQGLQITRVAAGDLNIIRVGHVKTGPTVLTVDPGLNLLAVPLATGTTLKTSGLRGTSTANGVQPGAEIGAADVIRTIGAGNVLSQFFFYQDPQDANIFGWLNEGGDVVDDNVLKEGSGFFLLRKAATAFPWTVPAQVIAP